jgi:diguanylate cyclase (GGDEF)-like protein
LRPILDVVKRINTERNLRRLVTMILDTAIRFSNGTRGTLAILRGDHFNAELSRHRTRGNLSHVEIPTLTPVIKEVTRSGRGIVVDNIRRDARFCPPAIVPGRHGISILCLPLRVKSRLIGAVYLDNTEEAGAFGSRQRELAEILTDHAAIAIENAMLYRKCTQDRLTNVFNHAGFEQLLEEEIERARVQGRTCGVLMVDVDNFKLINDTYGHEVGNDVLRDVAYTLATTVRGADIVGRVQHRQLTPVVGRYGGDEFEILLPGATPEGALATAARLATLIKSQRFTCGAKRLRVSISVGVAVFPDDGRDTQKLLLRADEALYKAKHTGKGRAVAYGRSG